MTEKTDTNEQVCTLCEHPLASHAEDRTLSFPGFTRTPRYLCTAWHEDRQCGCVLPALKVAS